MSDFDLEKKSCLDKLYKPDKSRKGDVDTVIIPMIEHINSLKDYYTTSSCSGRIQVLADADKKPDVKWLYVSHEEVIAKNILDALSEDNIKQYPKTQIWFRQENMILHIACRNIDSADKILKISRECGFRRSGIIADSNIIIVEICSTEKMDVPVADNGRILVTQEYIRFLVKIANEKFSRGREKLERVYSKVRERL